MAKGASYLLLIAKVKEYSELGALCNSTAFMLAVRDVLMIILHKLKNFSKEQYRKLHPGGSLGAMLKTDKQ